MKFLQSYSGRILFPALIVIGASTVLALLLNLIKASDGYDLVLEHVKTDKKVQEVLGDEIRPGWYAAGQMRDGGKHPEGFGLIEFPVKGSKNSGTVYAEVMKANHKWEVLFLSVKPKDGELISLVENPLSTKYWQPRLQ